MGQESPVPLFAASALGRRFDGSFLGPEDDVPFNENVSLRVCIVSQYAGANMILRRAFLHYYRFELTMKRE
ncbi:hypothetical protein N7524_005603 [Penicillium chrysogenum]|nr:hypothetical protein N7524_005603 [Penicillium chrysogenum]